MASKGYCGYLISFVGDITLDSNRSILINTSDRWLLIDDIALDREADRIVNDTVEKEIFHLWYNVPIKPDQ